ncbi:hypothetical protein [Thalassobellus sediminis]|uniref:hypothetical protein n=1 Tax=Thalassobellus sediminis TaxID=3367753 RepID=UPI0037BACCE0
MFTSSCKTIKKTDCLNIDSLIKSTITSINNRNTENYIDNIDFDKIERIWVESGGKDPSKLEILEYIKNRSNLIEMFSTSYNIMIQTIEKIHKLKDWKFDLESYEQIDKEKDDNLSTLKYNLKLKDNLGNKWNMIIYIVEHKDCYYSIEPFDANKFTKG